MRVLYVSHTAQVSGAERSLLGLIEQVSRRADIFLACPEGDLMSRAGERGIPTLTLDSLQLGFGSSPGAAASSVARLVRTGLQVRRFARRRRIDVIHASSARAGLITAFCAPGGPRRFVDVRDGLPRGMKAAVVRRLLRLSAEGLIFNSEFTSTQFGPSKPAREEVVYPCIDLERFLRLPFAAAERLRNAPVLGVVGQITPWKGHDDAIRILQLVRWQIPDARLRIVGSVVFSGPGVSFDNETFARDLRTLAASLGIAEAVEYTGATEDIPRALSAIDVLLVPSWQEPFGRVVAEAMAAGVPVVATSRGGPAELIDNGLTGYLAEPRRPEAWVEKTCRLLTDLDLRARVVDDARRRVTSVMDRRESAERVLALYAGTHDRQGSPIAAVRPKELV